MLAAGVAHWMTVLSAGVAQMDGCASTFEELLTAWHNTKVIMPSNFEKVGGAYCFWFNSFIRHAFLCKLKLLNHAC